MKLKRILCALFCVLMFISCLTAPAVAADEAVDEGETVDLASASTTNYLRSEYASAGDKLATMTKKTAANGYQIYVQPYTGEVAFQNTTTGQVIFSNPYDIATNNKADAIWPSMKTREQLMSQIVIDYEDNGQNKTMYSYTEAALRDQITVKNIKNGIRVEYTIGELQVTRLVPRRIEKSRFQSLIINNIDNEFHREKLMSFYELFDTSVEGLTERQIKEMEASFPITKRLAIYVCDTTITSKELKTCESIIKTYCPLYTYEEMDQDHTETEYVGTDKAPPNFKLALEYTLDETGLEVRLPANGIRFDESTYQLSRVAVLPYMGAGSYEYNGYTFIPDGSGSLIRFEELNEQSYTVSGELYGHDYAYHEIMGSHEETMTLPVFGVVTNYAVDSTAQGGTAGGAAGGTAGGTQGGAAGGSHDATAAGTSQDIGFAAIITEGDSLARLTSTHGGALHPYNSVYATFIPRPSDTYNLADAISGGENASWTVVTDRKYTGSYRIKYILLTDDKLAAENNVSDYYECSYVGMAKAYRDYLVSEQTIVRLTDDKVKSDVPLYVESFGSIKTTQKVFSFPVSVDTPLTTFEDIKTIYNGFAEAGITNVNFRLTGFANGGLTSTYPSRVKWVKALGGGDGFEELVSYSKEKGFGVYPDFDFAYMATEGWFDGVNIKRDAIKTIDSRYTSRRYYDSATQTFERDSSLAISTSVYEYFYSKFAEKYAKYENNAISAASLGTALNSDFDKDDPYNREDSKDFTVETLAAMKEKYSSVMTDGGNAYVLKYADHILKVPTTSSEYLNTSETVPFTGMVLHGFVSFSGNAINMEGDSKTAFLRSIENGAALYYTLSYQNTSELKESEDYNKYYSVAYNIWLDDVKEQYARLNEAMSDLQTSLIVDHEFIAATRVLTEAEQASQDAAIAEAEKKNEPVNKARDEYYERLSAFRARVASEYGVSNNDQDIICSGEKSYLEANGLYQLDVSVTQVATESGTVIRVEYEGGVNFVLNFNAFEITTDVNGESVNVPALDFVRIG